MPRKPKLAGLPENVTVELTPQELKTLQFYLRSAHVDAKGSCAIGVCSESTVAHLESIMKKTGTKPIE